MIYAMHGMFFEFLKDTLIPFQKMTYTNNSYNTIWGISARFEINMAHCLQHILSLILPFFSAVHGFFLFHQFRHFIPKMANNYRNWQRHDKYPTDCCHRTWKKISWNDFWLIVKFCCYTFLLIPGGFSDLIHYNNYNSNWKR